ncbi:hypothetical protein [Rhodococcoides trifolii]|nr:hypothetical protein [Rhodococcus trifolii]
MSSANILAPAYEQIRTVRDGGVEPGSGDVAPALMSAEAHEE